jgi:hypothetical protein
LKHVVSVSLGTPRRDHAGTLQVAGETVAVSRRGVDGSLERARALIAELDGTVDAIGLGGIDRYVGVGDARYAIRDAEGLAEAARRTPVVDGFGVKRVWEPEVVGRLVADGTLRAGQRVLMVSAMDRYFMAEALWRAGLEVVCGDLMFVSHIDYPIRSLEELGELARKLMPSLARLPFTALYPTGAEQLSEADLRFAHYFDEADVVAGDFHFIRRYAPAALAGKVVVTNTTTAEDLEVLRRRGVAVVATTTPRIAGRSFGANVVEAALVAVSGIREEDARWPAVVRGAGLAPTVRRLDGKGETEGV